MEINELFKFVLIIVLTGMIIGVGVLTLDKFGSAVKTDTASLAAVTFTAGVGTTANDDVTSINYITNGTFYLTGANATSPLTNVTTAGVISTYVDVTPGAYNVSYQYDADSPATTALASGRDEVSNVSTVWLGLIVTIAILAIILTMVIRSFSFGGKR